MLVNHSNSSGNDTIAQTRDFDTITFRIDRRVTDSFRKESAKSGISINALVNQVLRHYIEWDIFEPKVGMIPFPKVVLENIFAEMSDSQIFRLASSIGKKTAIDMAIFMEGRFDVLPFISWMETRMKNSGFELVRRVDNDKGIHTLIIKHDLGKNWSLYLKVMLESILADFFKHSEFIISDSILSVSFDAEKNK